MTELVIVMSAALLLTIAIEYGVLRFMGERRQVVLLSSVAVNIITNVPLNLYVYYVEPTITQMLIAEAVVVVVETLWYLLFTKRWATAFAYGFLCNAISALAGALLVLLTILFSQLLYSFT